MPTRRAGVPGDEEGVDSSKCPDCGKLYKHATSLLKHRWEHSAYWKPATKFLLTKHQQVQMMEAAAILLGMEESRGEGDKDPIVSMFVKQRGQLATGTSTASVSPPTSTKSLSASPPPMAERMMAMKQETAPSIVMSSPPFHGRASSMATRHSVTSTTSSASSLSSTPPSLAPDDESVAEVEDDTMMAVPPQFRQQPHHHYHHQPPQMMVEMGGQKYVEPQFYQHDHRYVPVASFQQHQNCQQSPPVPQHAPSPYAPYYLEH
ncbi:hypothetical protein EDD11_004815 [Mortierella claussenii]|nr:hypothetical protein EDD11_004815 [Mortierella claussenii]